GRGVRVLTYHRIDDLPGDRLGVSPGIFRTHLKTIRDRGYRVVTLDDLLDAPAAARPPDSPRLVITFDDGYRDWYDNAFPILQEFSYPGVFFLTVGLVDGSAEIPRYRTLAAERRRALTPGQIADMAGAGMRFESHGVTHREMPALSPGERNGELKESARKIAEWTGRAPGWFAFPRGKYVPEMIGELRGAGYRGAVTVDPGSNVRFRGYPLVRRTEISADDSLCDFGFKLRGGADFIHRLRRGRGEGS
nr:polysaccharide deacetylase family protein [bacterium]